MSISSSDPGQETSMGTARRDAWAREPVTSPDTMLQAQMGKIFGYTKGLPATNLIDLGNRLGLFRQVARTPAGLPFESLVAALGCHVEYVHLWCETACALELLDNDPTVGYGLAPVLDQILGQPEVARFTYFRMFSGKCPLKMKSL
jgi:hypothetical protein